MKSLMKKFFGFMLAFGVIVSYASISYGWSHNEHQVNTTGATAYDVVKILDGDYEITEMMNWDFAEHDYYHRVVDGKVQTVLRWWNGDVADGEAGDVCFTAVPLGGSASHAPIIGAWWTDEFGVPMGEYPFPAVSAGVEFIDRGQGLLEPVVHLVNNQAGYIEVNAQNADFWKEGEFYLGGEAGPIYIHGVKAGIVSRALTPATLNLDNTIKGPLADSFFDVFMDVDMAANPVPLHYNEDLTASLRNNGQVIYPGQSLVLIVDLGGGNYSLFNFEAPVPSPCGEPDDGILDIKDTKQKIGSPVTIPVRIQGALTQVFSGGFDIAYDPSVLSYIDFARGPLSDPIDFDMVKIADLGGGHLRIGAADNNGNITPGSYGDFVLLHFLVIGGVENTSYPVKILQPVDDFSSWPISAGCFTVIPGCDGDLNKDGWVSPEDARIAMQGYLTGPSVPCSDANGDGQVTPRDALCILQKFLGLPNCFDMSIINPY